MPRRARAARARALYQHLWSCPLLFRTFQEGIQSQAGRLILPSPLSPRVGTVTYYSATGAVEHTDRHKLASQEVGVTYNE